MLSEIRRQVFWFALLLLFLQVFHPVNAAQGQFNFLESKAAVAFKQGDFVTAETEFRLLAESYPEDVDVLRFYAITLDRLERYKDAVEVFSQALTLTPNSATIRYHLGVTLYKANLGTAAAEQFQLVVQLAEESRYAELAREYISAITEQRDDMQRPGAPNRFGLFAQLSFKNDDNIPALPRQATLESTKREGNRGSEYVALDYNLLRKPDSVGGLRLSAYGAQYVDEEFGAFEVFQYAAGAFLQKKFRLGNLPITTKLDLETQRVELGDEREPYSDTNKAVVSALFHMTENQSLAIHYQLVEDDYDNEGFDPAISSRDADIQEGGLAYKVYFAEKTGSIGFFVRYAEDDAEGLNYNREAVYAGVSLQLPLPANWNLKLAAEYMEDEYPDFAGPEIRETETRDYTVEFSRWLGNRVLMRLTWSDHEEESNYDALSYRRTAWGVDVSYVY